MFPLLACNKEHIDRIVAYRHNVQDDIDKKDNNHNYILHYNRLYSLNQQERLCEHHNIHMLFYQQCLNRSPHDTKHICCLDH